MIESEILETGILKNTSKIGQFKDDRKYILSNDVDKLQDNLLKIVENESKDDNYFGNILSLTNNQNKKWTNIRIKRIRDKDNQLVENSFLICHVLSLLGACTIR